MTVSRYLGVFSVCKQSSPAVLPSRRRRWSADGAVGGQSVEHNDERCGCRSHRETDWRPSCRTPAWCWCCRTTPATADQRLARFPPRILETECSTRRLPAASSPESSRRGRPGHAWRASSLVREPLSASTPMSGLYRFHGVCRRSARLKSDGRCGMRWVSRRMSATGVLASVGTPVN